MQYHDTQLAAEYARAPSKSKVCAIARIAIRSS